MPARLAGLAAAALLLLVALLAAAGAAIAQIVLAPVTLAGQALDGHIEPKQLAAAQYCALGKITPGRPTGYGAFTAQQLANATTIDQVAAALSLPPYAAQIAIAAALQESDLLNLDHGDRDSLGLFQQRPSQGWGTPEQIMDPVYASTKFYQALIRVPNWQILTLTEAADAVERSAYPDAYAKWTYTAGYLIAAVSGALVGSQCR